MIKVGITGGIGSGKTYVCRLFQSFGIPVYFADDRAKHLMQEDDDLIADLVHAFGASIYDGGTLQRAALAEKVFGDDEALRTLNGIVHPAVARDADHWMQNHTDSPYVLKEAALLFESGSYQRLDSNILVYASEEVRILRVMERDGVSEDAVRARMAHQWSDERKMELADYMIHNDGTRDMGRLVERFHTLFSQRYVA